MNVNHKAHTTKCNHKTHTHTHTHTKYKTKTNTNIQVAGGGGGGGGGGRSKGKSEGGDGTLHPVHSLTDNSPFSSCGNVLVGTNYLQPLPDPDPTTTTTQGTKYHLHLQKGDLKIATSLAVCTGLRQQRRQCVSMAAPDCEGGWTMYFHGLNRPEEC